MNFSELGLKATLLKALEAKGFTQPSDIQEKAIPLLLDCPTDFVGQAQTGTGKTAAFLLPLLQRLNTETESIEAIILSPTRELALQIEQELQTLKKFEKNVRSLCVYGGTPLDRQVMALRKDKPQIVIGTPGRVIDLIERGKLKLNEARFCILDEADEMLNMGFLEDVQWILQKLSEERRIWMFSATMPKAILDLISRHFHSPAILTTKKKTLSNEDIEQKFFVVREGDQIEALGRLIDRADDCYGIVFCRTKIEAKRVADELNQRGFQSDSLHGDMSQDQRELAMRSFKAKRIKLLVCTDVAARGIDVNDLTHVFNYGLPQDIESYVHRIGRTGRAGAKGIAYTIISPKDSRRIRLIEKHIKAPITQGLLPTPEELGASAMSRALTSLLDEENRYPSFLKRHEKALAMFTEKLETFTKEEVIASVFGLLLKQDLVRYEKRPNLDVVQSPASQSRDGGGMGMSAARSNRGEKSERLFITLGKEHGLGLRSFLKAFSQDFKIPEAQISRVEIRDKVTYFSVPQSFSARLTPRATFALSHQDSSKIQLANKPIENSRTAPRA